MSVRLSEWELGVLLRGLEDVLAPKGRVDLARDMVVLRNKLRWALVKGGGDEEQPAVVSAVP